MWADTTNDLLKQRNAADSAWVDILTLSTGVSAFADNGLSGNKIDGGTISNFASTGIDDNATSTSITIDSSERVSLKGATHYDSSTALSVGGRINTTNGTVTGSMNYGGGTKLNLGSLSNHNVNFMTSNTTQLELTTDGRGLSQFTAKAWVNFNGTSTVDIRDSHNVSSITDNGTGKYTVNFTINMSNDDYAVSGSAGSESGSVGHRDFVFGGQVAGQAANFTTSAFNCMAEANNTGYDADNMHAVVFGD
jgi:hypothetical protein